MKRVMRLFLPAAFAVAAVFPAHAAMLGDASVGFSADRTVTVNGQAYTGRLYHMPGHERHEQDLLGMHDIFLLDAGAARGWLVLPLVKTYVEFRFPPLMAELDADRLLHRPAGQEVVEGVPTTKYRIDHTAKDGSRAKGFAWVSRDNVLMKLEGNVTRGDGGRPLAISMRLSGLKLGPQDPALFDLPAGFSKLPEGALAPLLGAAQPGAAR